MYKFNMLIPVMAALLFASGLPSLASVQAACPPGYVLIDEDEEYFYCQKPGVYVKCITEAGALLKNAKPQCVAEVSQCFRGEEPGLNDAALQCGLGCLGSALNLPACLAICGYSTYTALRVYEKCAGDRWNDCFGAALIRHRHAVDACKR